MKTYFKILAVTASVQLLGFVLTYAVDGMMAERSGLAPFLVGAAFLLVSMILGVVLPMKRFRLWRNRLLTIFLLPTNYTWLVIAFGVIRLVGNLLNILEGIPDNFG